MAVGYAFVIAFVVVIAVISNSEVNASIAKKEFNAAHLHENIISRQAGVQNQTSIDNIRSLFEKFSPREKNIEQEIEVASGDTFISILKNIGLDYNQANEVFAELKKVYDPRRLKIGQKVAFLTLIDTKDENKLISLNRMVVSLAADERVVVERTEQNTYAARVEKDELVEEVNTASGVITGNLSVAMQDQGIPRGIVADFINIFAFSIDFSRDVRFGDKFEVVYENYINQEGELIRTGNILYASLTLRKDKVALYRFKDKSGTVDYYDEKGFAMKKTLDRKPLAFRQARVTSPFGRRRHPIYGDIRIHWGIDYAAPRGTPIFAAGDGIVQMAQWHGGYGNYIKIRHNSEYSTAYGHMQRFAGGIRPGTRVKQGQIIAYVGNTGNSTGPHLHYEVIKGGRRVSPATIKASASENLKGKDFESFKQVVAEVKTSHPSMFAAAEKQLASAATTETKKQ